MKQFKDYAQMQKSPRLQTNVIITMQSNHWDYETMHFFDEIQHGYTRM